MSRICICGGGSLGHVCTGFFSSHGHSVSILTGHPSDWSGEIVVTDGEGKVYIGKTSCVSDRADVAVPGADIILLCVPGYLVEDTLKEIKPYAGSAMTGCVVASTGFFQCAHSVLGPGAGLFSFQRTPFIARVDEYGKSAKLLGYKKELLCAVENAGSPEEFASLLADLFGTDVRLLTGWQEAALSNSNPILHTARLFGMLGGKESIASKPLFYRDWDDASSDVLIAMDSEFMALVRLVCGQGSSIQPILEYYESRDSRSLTEKISSIPAFRTIESPLVERNGLWVPDAHSRYFTEDFPFGLKFIRDMCRSHGLDCPVIDKVYEWGCSILRLGL